MRGNCQDEQLNEQRIYESTQSMGGNCQDCENEKVHICPLDDIEDIETVNDLNTETDDNEQYYDTVLDTFYQKTDTGNGVSDVIAEQIVTNCANKKVIVAPTDAGHFMNYESDVHIEEKCFPHLFPKGVGGYMSTYFPKKVTFSNYIKMRLNGIDRRFSTDHLYIIFLYQVKESLEIKRSRVTYFRKSKCNSSKYNKSTIGNMSKLEIERTDAGFKAFKNVRGTTPYFQNKKN